VHDDGSGEALYAIGQFSAGTPGTTNLARWNGSAWESVGGGLPGPYANALATFQGDLIAAGYFDSAGGVDGTAKLARWDGTQWNSMDAQSEIFLNSMWDLLVYDDGSGEKLWIAGNYGDLGGPGGPSHLATWDGTSYAPVGAPIGGAVPLIVLDIEAADLGDGSRLYAGGRFLNIDGVPANNIASWDGSSWSAVGAGFAADVQELTVFDDGSGPALYAAGNFEAANGGIDHIAKWNGTSWEQVGAGANANIFGAIVYDAGEGPALHFGGSFTSAGGLASNRVVSLLAQGGGGCNDADNAEPFGVLDLADVQGFIGAFVGQQAPADIAPPSGVWDLADVQAFIAAFNAGCP
jgi:hypothetical protein